MPSVLTDTLVEHKELQRLFLVSCMSPFVRQNNLQSFSIVCDVTLHHYRSVTFIISKSQCAELTRGAFNPNSTYS